MTAMHNSRGNCVSMRKNKKKLVGTHHRTLIRKLVAQITNMKWTQTPQARSLAQEQARDLAGCFKMQMMRRCARSMARMILSQNLIVERKNEFKS
jgi:hypothetical protein